MSTIACSLLSTRLVSTIQVLISLSSHPKIRSNKDHLFPLVDLDNSVGSQRPQCVGEFVTGKRIVQSLVELLCKITEPKARATILHMHQ